MEVGGDLPPTSSTPRKARETFPLLPISCLAYQTVFYITSWESVTNVTGVTLVSPSRFLALEGAWQTWLAWQRWLTGRSHCLRLRVYGTYQAISSVNGCPLLPVCVLAMGRLCRSMYDW